jgi:CHAT domain-containing protein
VLLELTPTLNLTLDAETQDMLPDSLSVERIFNCISEKAVLAFLSACCTADVQNAALAGEHLHIANAFQIAGYSHAVGTLWLANDGVCPEFAQLFYGYLGKWMNEVPLGNDLISMATQLAAVMVGREYIDSPLMWACFIHVGP